MNNNVIVTHGLDIERLKNCLDYYLDKFDINLTRLTAVEFYPNGGFKLVVTSNLSEEFPTQKIYQVGFGFE